MKKYYTEKGYNVGKRGSTFEIKVEDLSPNSNAVVDVICDFCGKEYTMKYCKYLLTKDSGNCCKECKGQKAKKTNLERYGVENTSQLQSVKDKRELTCLSRFGQKTNLMTDENKRKQKETTLKRYGVEYITQSKEFRDKIAKTNIERYGFENAMQNEDIKKKVRMSLYENSTCPSSRAQRHVCKLLDGLLNYAVDWYNLDIYFPEYKVYIEYQGSGHNLNVKSGEISEIDFIKKEVTRYNYIKSLGFKMIEFINKTDKLPDDEIIIDLFEKALTYFETSDRNYISIDLDKL